MDDIVLHNYQDDLDTSDDKTDPIVPELTDDPTELLGIDPKELKAELDKYDFDESDVADDQPETTEDHDVLGGVGNV